MAQQVIDLTNTGLVIGDLTWSWCKRIDTGANVSVTGATLTERGNGIYIISNGNVTVDTDFRMYVTADSTKYAIGVFSTADGNLAIETGGGIDSLETSVGSAGASLTAIPNMAKDSTVAKEDGGRLQNAETQATNAASSASDAAAAGLELENRLTTLRAGYLDWLNIGGLAASQADIQGVTQAQRVRVIPPAMMERPDSNSLAYRVWIYAYDAQHVAEDLDSNPTVTAENNAGADRSANLGTVTKPGGTTGQYYVDYAIASDHAIEGLVFKVNATEGSVTTQYAASSIVVDTTAVDFTAADRIILEGLATTLTAIKGASWSTETLKAIKDAVDLKLATSAYTAPDNANIGVAATQATAAATALGTAGGGEATVHEKLGAYAGGSGDNKNVKDDIANIAGSGGGSAYPSLTISPTGTFAQVGNAVRWDVYTLSANGVPTAPDTTPTAELKKPDGTAHSTLTLAEVATGHYTTSWTPATTDAAGEYPLRVAATIGGQTYKASGSVGLGNVATGQGMGLYSRTVQAYIGPATTTPIAGATVHVWNSGKTIVLSQGTTDANGQFVAYLNAGTYKVVLANNSYTFSEATKISSADWTLPIYGTAFAPTAPSTAAKCTLYGWVKDAQGTAVSGVAVTVSVLDKKAYFVDATSGEWVRPSDVTATTNANGYWEIQLIRSAKLTPAGAKYRVKIPAASGHESYIKDVTVPNSDSAELRNL